MIHNALEVAVNFVWAEFVKQMRATHETKKATSRSAFHFQEMYSTCPLPRVPEHAHESRCESG